MEICGEGFGGCVLRASGAAQRDEDWTIVTTKEG